MRVAHIGPPRARLGGPAGYLHELARAAGGADVCEARGHKVLFPPLISASAGSTASAAAAGSAAPQTDGLPVRLLGQAKRLGRLVRGPAGFYRPPRAELETPRGRLHESFLEVGSEQLQASAASLAAAEAADAEALFVHDVLVAERLLAERDAGRLDRRLWLLIHAPFPIALYLAWTWAVPELAWQEVLAFPDVAVWVEREIAVHRRVDRLLLPCPEAGDELVRADPRFAPALAGAGTLLSGAGLGSAARPGRALDVVELRRRFKLPEGEPVGLFLGSAQPYRGLDALLAAVRLLPPRRRLPGVVAVAGPPPSSLPRHPRLRSLGRVSDVAALLGAVDFVINVNRFSLFDLSTIEAAEAGRALLLHATGGNRTFRRLGAGCVMLDDLAPESVAAGLTRMLALTPAERAILGGASRACYDAELTPARLWERHLDLYDAAAESELKAGPQRCPAKPPAP